MTSLSDTLLVVAIFGYLAAMTAHTAAYALRHQPSSATTVPAAVPDLVTAGALTGPLRQRPPAAANGGSPDRRTDRDWRALLEGAAVGVTAAAATAHLATAATRGLSAARMPWGNMYEFVLSVTLIGAVAWLALAVRRPLVRPLGVVFNLIMVLLLGFAGLVLYVQVSPLVPALQSYWFVIHVTAAVTASGLFLVGFVPAAMFLVRDGFDAGKTRFPYTLGSHLPAASAMEQLTFRVHALAFPVWTFAVAAGAVWAEAAWGRYWGWDPKEVWAFISWVVYAAYLHARNTPSTRRRVVAWIAILGFATMLMNLFGVNFFFTGLHSYAGTR